MKGLAFVAAIAISRDGGRCQRRFIRPRTTI